MLNVKYVPLLCLVRIWSHVKFCIQKAQPFLKGDWMTCARFEHCMWRYALNTSAIHDYLLFFWSINQGTSLLDYCKLASTVSIYLINKRAFTTYFIVGVMATGIAASSYIFFEYANISVS